MGHRLLLQRLPAAWNCSFIQYGKQVAGAAPAIVASYQPWQNCARAYTESGCLLCASICVRNQDTGQRNSVPPTAPLNNQQNDPVVYLHFGELAQCLYLHCLRSTITEPRLCTRTQALPQCLPVLPPVDYRPWTCICTHTRVNWRSTCRHCLLWTTLPSCVPAHIQERDSSTLQTLPPVDTGPGRVPARTSVRVGTALTGVASHRQAVLDKYMHTWSVKLAQCIPVLPPADNRSQLCRASWHSAHWRCILLTTGPGCVPARILGRARSQPTNAASCQQAAWTRICTNTRATWHSVCRRWLPSTSRPGRVSAGMYGRAGAAPAGVASRWQSAPTVSCELVQCLSALPPVDNRPQLCTCTHTRRACSPPTDIAPCWQSALGTYLHVYLGELGQDYRRCLLSNGPWHVPVYVLRRAGAAPTGVASYWQSAPTSVGRAGAAPTGVASRWYPAPAVYLHPY